MIRRVRQAARALGLPDDAWIGPAAGGASGSAWRVRERTSSYVLRIAEAGPLTDARLEAMRRARDAGLPAPELVRRASTSGTDAVLLTWLPGIPLADAVRRRSGDAPAWGRLMGRMQRELHTVRAPIRLPSVTVDGGHPFAAGRSVTAIPHGDSLLHLDWHPLNLLVDAEAGQITGIIDWDNARRGAPLLDVARTESILTLDPGLTALPAAELEVVAALTEGWATGYGPEASALPAVCRTWAAHVMLTDLRDRFRHAPEALDPVRARLTEG